MEPKTLLAFLHRIEPLKTNTRHSVTAAGANATDLDGYTTAFFVLGPEKGIALAERTGLDVLYLTDDGRILATKGFADGKYRFTRNPARSA